MCWLSIQLYPQAKPDPTGNTDVYWYGRSSLTSPSEPAPGSGLVFDNAGHAALSSQMVCLFVVPTTGVYEMDLVGGTRIRYCAQPGKEDWEVQYTGMKVYAKRVWKHNVKGIVCGSVLPTETNGLNKVLSLGRLTAGDPITISLHSDIHAGTAKSADDGVFLRWRISRITHQTVAGLANRLYSVESNRSCGGGGNDQWTAEQMADTGIKQPANQYGAQLKGSFDTAAKCQAECDSRWWCTQFKHGLQGTYRASECWLHKEGCGIIADDPSFDFYRLGTASVFVQKPTKQGTCSGPGETNLTLSECNIAVAGQRDTLHNAKGQDYGISLPKGCFRKLDGKYYFNHRGVAGTPQSPLGRRICQEHTACNAGYYLNGDSCARCSNDKCATGPGPHYRQGTCAGNVNGYTCHKCSNNVCSDWQYREGYCGGGRDDGFRCTTYAGNCTNGKLITFTSRRQHNHCGSCMTGFVLVGRNCSQSTTTTTTTTMTTTTTATTKTTTITTTTTTTTATTTITSTTRTTMTQIADCAYTLSTCTAACEVGASRTITVTREPSSVQAKQCPSKTDLPDCLPGDGLCPTTSTTATTTTTTTTATTATTTTTATFATMTTTTLSTTITTTTTATPATTTPTNEPVVDSNGAGAVTTSANPVSTAEAANDGTSSEEDDTFVLFGIIVAAVFGVCLLVVAVLVCHRQQGSPRAIDQNSQQHVRATSNPMYAVSDPADAYSQASEVVFDFTVQALEQEDGPIGSDANLDVNPSENDRSHASPDNEPAMLVSNEGEEDELGGFGGIQISGFGSDDEEVC